MITKEMEQEFVELVKKFDGKWKFSDFEYMLFKNRDIEKFEFIMMMGTGIQGYLLQALMNA